LKFGIPLNLSLAPIVSFIIPLVWPLWFIFKIFSVSSIQFKKHLIS
jgi:hypothetical protein